LATAAKVTVSGALLAFLLAKGGVRDLGRTITHTSPTWLAVGFGFGVMGAFVTISQWHALLGACGVRRSWWRCFRLEWACDVFDAALPSSIGGDVLRAILVAEDPSERVPAASSVVLRRLLNFPGMVVLMAAGLAASWSFPEATRIRPYALGAIALGAVGVVVAVSPLAGRLGRLALLQRFGATRALGSLLRELDGFRSNRRALTAAAVRGTVFWCVVVMSQWSYMRAVGIHVPVAYAAAVVTVINAATMLPISLGGYGLREGGFSAFLAVGGMATVSQGIGVGLCLTAQTMAFGFIGLPVYLTLRRRVPARIPEVPAPPLGTVVACAS